jgi:hypothetical protein
LQRLDKRLPVPVPSSRPGRGGTPPFFGFILEGRHHSDDLDPFEVPLHGFRVVDPTGREQREQEAMLALARQMRLQRFKMNDDGTLTQIEGS